MFKTLLLASSLAAGSQATTLATESHLEAEASAEQVGITEVALLSFLTYKVFFEDTREAADFDYPGHNCCKIYTGTYYTNSHEKICYDEAAKKPTVYETSGKGFGTIESIYCGKNVAFDLCQDDDDTCQGSLDYHGAGFTRIGNLDTTSYEKIIVDQYDVKSTGAVTTFSGAGCQSDPGRFYGPNIVGGIAEYPSESSLIKHGAEFGDVESIQIPYGFAVELFTEQNFGGTNTTIVGPMFLNKNEQMQCIPVKNSAVQSIRVYKTKQIGEAYGEWTSFTHSEDISMKVTTGLTTGRKTDKKTTHQWAMALELSQGIGTHSHKVKSGYSGSIMKDVLDTMGHDQKQQLTIDCSERGERKGVGLWQWVVKSADRSTVVKTAHTVCRYGEGVYNTAPQCPWNACLDAMCLKCEEGWGEPHKTTG